MCASVLVGNRVWRGGWQWSWHGVEGNGHSKPGGYTGGLEDARILFGLIRAVVR